MHNQFETLPYVQHITDPNWYHNGGDLTSDEFGLHAARELEKRIDLLGEENIAAFIAEPIQGAGGVIVPPDTYWPEVRRILMNATFYLSVTRSSVALGALAICSVVRPMVWNPIY